MDLGRLRSLRELALRKTMAAAADALSVSPSAISQQISQLEQEAGVELVERRGRGVTLTSAGRTLVAHAERIIAVLEEAKTDLAEMKRIVAGELRVTAFPSVASALIPTTIRELGRRHPRLQILFHEMEPTESVLALRAWQTDLALIDDLTVPADLQEVNVETVELIDDSLYAILPSSHPLAAKPAIELRELRNERWVLDTASHAYSEVVIRQCRAHGFEPLINAYCNGIDVMLALIEVACSISVLPGFRLRRYAGNFAVRRIDPEIRRKIMIAFRRGERRNPAIDAFTTQLLESAAGLKDSSDPACPPLRT